MPPEPMVNFRSEVTFLNMRELLLEYATANAASGSYEPATAFWTDGTVTPDMLMPSKSFP